MAAIPSIRKVSLGAGTITDQNTVIIAAGATRVLINPLTTTTEVQYAFNRDDVNTTGRFGTLLDGQPVELSVNAGDQFPALTLSLFASVAVEVDVVWW